MLIPTVKGLDEKKGGTQEMVKMKQNRTSVFINVFLT